jgi:anthranilate phosphoribosyltransferase
MEDSQKIIQELTDQLAAAKSQAAELNAKLNEVTLEQQLFRRLSDAGVSDIESAMLLAKSRIKGSDEQELDKCIEQLHKEKSHLFAGSRSPVVFQRKTAGTRQQTPDADTILAQAAGKAAATGNRKDLQEYLKLRRNYL